MGVLLGVDQDDAVLVEQNGVALDDNLEVAAVLEAEPGAAVGQGVGIHAGGRVEGRAHAGAGLAVPGTGSHLDVDGGRLPDRQLGLVGAAVVAA